MQKGGPRPLISVNGRSKDPRLYGGNRVSSEASASASILRAQRLGYLLEYVGAGDMAMLLKKRLRQRARDFTKLLPSMSAERALRSKDWRLFVNAGVGAYG